MSAGYSSKTMPRICLERTPFHRDDTLRVYYIRSGFKDQLIEVSEDNDYSLHVRYVSNQGIWDDSHSNVK